WQSQKGVKREDEQKALAKKREDSYAPPTTNARTIKAVGLAEPQGKHISAHKASPNIKTASRPCGRTDQR
ncbi:MAG: hypothetical protein WCL60_15050, partial [Methylococcales bacterium]